MTKRIGALALGVAAILSMSALAWADETAAAATAAKAPAKTETASKMAAPAKTPRAAITAKEHMGLTKEDAMAVQSALEKAGIYKGTVDGRFGKQTRAALREYQKSNGLKVNGRADEETLSKLGVTLSANSHAEKAPAAMAKPAAEPKKQ